MQDFEEIGHTGGKIEIKIEGTNAQFTIKHSNCSACRIESISIPFGDKPLPVFIVSDKEGFFGAKCQECNTYFRTSRFNSNTTCPYCGLQGPFLAFLTENQKKYIEAYVNKFLKLFQSGKSGEIDFDALIEKLDNNTGFVYSDERQQTVFQCTKCQNRNDIIGIYGYCSECGYRNNLDIFNEKLAIEMNRVINPKYDKSERQLREKEWQEVMKSSISAFEGFARDVHKELLKLPLHPNQRKAISNISFQRILDARDALLNIYKYDIFGEITNEDITFINKSFNKRHLFTHNEGLVDEDYIKKTGDMSVKVGQLVRVGSNEVKRLIELLESIGKKFVTEYDSIE